MNHTTVNKTTQPKIERTTLNFNLETAAEKFTRAERRRKKHELSKENKGISSMQTQHNEEIFKLEQEILNDMKSSTWWELETKEKLRKNIA